MRSLAPVGLAVLLAVLAMSGCFKDSSKSPSSKKTDSHVATSETVEDTPASKEAAEAEVKPAPVDAPPAAAAPAIPLAGTSQPQAAPATPDQQTKETLEPNPLPQTALSAPAASTNKKSGKNADAKAPARSIAVVGDSLAVGIGMTMEQHVKQYEGMSFHSMGKVSTGLINKKSFDWEKKLTELVTREKPAAVVVMMGGNDANNSIAGKAPGTPEWNEAYRQKAENFLKIAADSGVKVLWVGLPVMRDPAYSSRVQGVNAAAKEACSKVTGCAYMEPSPLFADASGNFAQSKEIDGKTVSLRGKDGVHMTMNGYDLLCRQVLDNLAASGTVPQQQ